MSYGNEDDLLRALSLAHHVLRELLDAFAECRTATDHVHRAMDRFAVAEDAARAALAPVAPKGTS